MSRRTVSSRRALTAEIVLPQRVWAQLNAYPCPWCRCPTKLTEIIPVADIYTHYVCCTCAAFWFGPYSTNTGLSE